MKKMFLLFFILFLSIPAVFADITIQTDQNAYNLGNKIKVSASAMRDSNFEGLFKLTISCGEYKLQYFLTPISLEVNFRTAVGVPDLVATSSMLGNCSIAGDLLTNDNLAIEEKESSSFEVVSQLNVLPVEGSITAMPGDSIHVSGIVNEAFGNNVLRAATKIALDNDSYVIEAIDGKFNLTLQLAKNIKSGKHEISISSSDQKNNAGSGSIGLFIKAIPTYIKNQLSHDNLMPGSKVAITSSLFDQADELINATLDLDLSHNGNNVFKKNIQSNEKMDYEFSQYSEPGIYILTGSYNSLFAKSSINITTVREVKVRYENETVVIENIGNIPYEDELTFLLQSQEKKFPIAKKVRIEAGKILNVDLSKEVPFGIYDVIAPLKQGLAPVQKKISDTLKDENVLASEVTIHDNRPAYKKIESSLASISGSLVGADGVLTKNPLVGPIILVAIVSLLVFRYGRKSLMNLIKRKKEDEGKEEKI